MSNNNKGELEGHSAGGSSPVSKRDHSSRDAFNRNPIPSPIEIAFGRTLWTIVIPIVRYLFRNRPFEIISPAGHRTVLGDQCKVPLAIRFHSYSALFRIVMRPRLALGEEYADGNWQMERGSLSEFISLTLSISNRMENSLLGKLVFQFRRRLFLAKQNYGLLKSRVNVETHYDQGDELFASFLDKNLVYTCADFEHGASNLDQAQVDKINNTLRRLDLRPGQKLLEIGSGWGCASLVAASEFRTKVTGLTLSRNQLKYAEKKRDEKSVSNVRYELEDYRKHNENLPGIYDRVMSIGMVEHVGYHQLYRYFQEVSRLLKPGGITLAHTIVREKPGITNAWINKYIFPGGYIASIDEVTKAAECAGLSIHCPPYQYAPENYIKTLRLWNEKLQNNWPHLKRRGYSEKVRLMYEFYFAGSEAAFKEMNMRATQFVFFKPRKAA